MKKCNHYPKLVIDIWGIKYYGASKSGIMEFDGDLVVNFTRDSGISSASAIPELADHLAVGFKNEITLPWPDMGLPKVKDTFWSALEEYIMDQGYTKVCFHCDGGHGRTGTALAAMLICVYHFDTLEAISKVREEYCSEAVETTEQVEYLKGLDLRINKNKCSADIQPSMGFYIKHKTPELKFVSYDGKFPNLCSGQLVMSLDGMFVEFPNHCLSSGGSCGFRGGDYSNEYINKGPWKIGEWPNNFPEELKDTATRLVNENVREGCCGGCI